MTCPDYDLCAECHSQHHDDVHPEHNTWNLPGIFCDGCGKRDLASNDCHTCLMCRDYDLCAECHTSRLEVHPEHDSWKVHSDTVACQETKVEANAATPDQECVACLAAEEVYCFDTAERDVVDASTEQTGDSSEDFTEASEPVPEERCEHFHVGEEEVKSSACADALSLLLDHADEAVRIAARQAMSIATKPETPTNEPNQEVDNFVTLSSGDISSDEEWEQFDEWEKVEQV